MDRARPAVSPVSRHYAKLSKLAACCSFIFIVIMFYSNSQPNSKEGYFLKCWTIALTVTSYLWEGEEVVFWLCLGVTLVFLSFLASPWLDPVSLQVRGSSLHRPLSLRALDTSPRLPNAWLRFILSICVMPSSVFRTSVRIRQGFLLQDEIEKQLFTTFLQQRLLCNIVPPQGILTYRSSTTAGQTLCIPADRERRRQVDWCR